MKVKLLKKIRKRFQIIHMPNGFITRGEHFNYNLLKLTDSTNEYYADCVQIRNEKDDSQYGCRIVPDVKTGVDYLKSVIIQILRAEGYRQRKDKKIETAQKKIWYNSK